MAGKHSISKRRSATKSKQKQPEPLVYFLDRSIDCEVVIAAFQSVGAEMRIHKDHFADDEKDEVWIPEVAQRGWIILTRDKRIRYRVIEKQALIASKARSFVLTSGNLCGQEMADILVKQLGKIDRVSRNNKPPFVAAVTKTGVRVLDL